jgi:hypothetical protein
MEIEFVKEQKYKQEKKRPKKIKGFYTHFAVYIIVNVFLYGVIIFGLTGDRNNEYNFLQAISHFSVYATWVFWGIGLFFHWLGVFGSAVFFGKNWEKKQIEKYMDDTIH